MMIGTSETGAAPPPPPLEHAHHAPPPSIRAVHKLLQKAAVESAWELVPVLDFSGCDVSSEDQLSSIPEYHRKRLKLSGTVPRTRAEELFGAFEDASGDGTPVDAAAEVTADGVPIYTHSSVPGLQIVPSLLPLRTQANLLKTLLRRDLSLTETHRTNLHAHYTLPSPCPFFDLPPATAFTPTDPRMHKPLTVSSALTKKLRWVTLGGQYDWTAKRYPNRTPPEFPTDVADLIHGLFPEITPQAAIVNLYAPGDTLAPHRDISEESRKGLASISIGCSGVFVIGIEREDEDAEVLAVRLNSGDAVVMSGESRWAWHSVPKILHGTCPPGLESWPRGEWEGWMKNKRINLNIRQMWDH